MKKDTKIQKLKISTRVKNSVYQVCGKEDISLQELSEFKSSDFSNIKGVGKRTVFILESILYTINRCERCGH